MDLRKGVMIKGCRFVLSEPVINAGRLHELMKTKDSIFVRNKMYPTAFIQNWQYRLLLRCMDNGLIWETIDLVKRE